jgi:hypothetical protein
VLKSTLSVNKHTPRHRKINMLQKKVENGVSYNKMLRIQSSSSDGAPQVVGSENFDKLFNQKSHDRKGKGKEPLLPFTYPYRPQHLTK